MGRANSSVAHDADPGDGVAVGGSDPEPAHVGVEPPMPPNTKAKIVKKPIGSK